MPRFRAACLDTDYAFGRASLGSFVPLNVDCDWRARVIGFIASSLERRNDQVWRSSRDGDLGAVLALRAMRVGHGKSRPIRSGLVVSVRNRRSGLRGRRAIAELGGVGDDV